MTYELLCYSRVISMRQQRLPFLVPSCRGHHEKIKLKTDRCRWTVCLHQKMFLWPWPLHRWPWKSNQRVKYLCATFWFKSSRWFVSWDHRYWWNTALRIVYWLCLLLFYDLFVVNMLFSECFHSRWTVLEFDDDNVTPAIAGQKQLRDVLAKLSSTVWFHLGRTDYSLL